MTQEGKNTAKGAEWHIDIFDDSLSVEVHGDHANHGCLHKTEEFLEHPITQLIMILLVFFDCGIVIAELLIDRDAVQVEDVAEVKEVFHYTSITILGIFLFEAIVKMIIEGLAFFLHYIEVVDALVVAISFIVDIMSLAAENRLRGVGLIIILRLWRIARIVNGIIASVKKHMRKQIEELAYEKNQYKNRLDRAVKVVETKVEEIKLLEGILDKEGIDYRQAIDKIEEETGDVAESTMDIKDDISDNELNDNPEEEKKAEEKKEGDANSLQSSQSEKDNSNAEEVDKRSSKHDSDGESHHSDDKESATVDTNKEDNAETHSSKSHDD